VKVTTHPRGLGLVQAVLGKQVNSGEAYQWVNNCNGMLAKSDSISYSSVKPNDLFSHDLDSPTPPVRNQRQSSALGPIPKLVNHGDYKSARLSRPRGDFRYSLTATQDRWQQRRSKSGTCNGLVIRKSWDTTPRDKRDMLYGNEQAVMAVDGGSGNAPQHDHDSALTHPSPAQAKLSGASSIK
jgi:hypothetical protein